MQVPDLVAPIVDFVFPPRCPLCGTALAQHGGLCAACWSELVIPAEPCCRRCGRPFASAAAAEQDCAPCLETRPRHAGIVAATLYNEASRRLVLAFKRGGRVALAPLLGRLIRARLTARRQADVGPDWLVVPVPLHRWRLWSRGYNQSALLAREIARGLGAGLLVDGLLRTRPTPTLGGLGRSARARVMKGAITAAPRRRTAIAGARVLLVDDVLTSGATTDACVRALLRAGAREVLIACFARVGDEILPDSHARGGGYGLPAGEPIP